VPWKAKELEEGSKVVVELSGIVDSTNVEEFFAFISSLLKSGVKYMVMDMEHTSYISSGGLSVIVDAHKKVQAEGGKLVIAGASSLIAELLDVAQISRVIEVYGDLDQALQAL